jgi:hypothetical protein
LGWIIALLRAEAETTIKQWWSAEAKNRLAEPKREQDYLLPWL